MSERKRRYPNGMPLSKRTPQFSTRQTGRLTHLEYNIIDMMQRTRLFDLLALHPYLGMSYEASCRAWSRMKNAGIFEGAPSSFRVTRDGLDAFREADAWLLDPASRPQKVTIRVAVGERRLRRTCWPDEVERVKQMLREEFGGMLDQLELAV